MARILTFGCGSGNGSGPTDRDGSTTSTTPPAPPTLEEIVEDFFVEIRVGKAVADLLTVVSELRCLNPEELLVQMLRNEGRRALGRHTAQFEEAAARAATICESNHVDPDGEE